MDAEKAEDENHDLINSQDDLVEVLNHDKLELQKNTSLVDFIAASSSKGLQDQSDEIKCYINDSNLQISSREPFF